MNVRVLKIYLSIIKKPFDREMYSLSAMKPTRWWKLFPRLHYALFNNRYLNNDGLGFHQKKGFGKEYSEIWYLKINEDVHKAVVDGDFTCGLEHYKLFGQYEGRAWYRNHPKAYQAWIKYYESEQKKITTVLSKVKISIILPAYNSKKDWLIEAIESVKKQTYQNWELCIADDASTDKSLEVIYKKYAAEDSRIKYTLREYNGHISEASNSALAIANGDWIALMDHDDILAPEALFEVVKAITDNPTARLIYSDEDKIDSRGNRSDPYFKPDWNRDLFLSHNLISHLGVYYKPIIDKIQGFRVGYEGSQDYDLALRFIDHIKDSEIYHISKILYHWRIHPESTASAKEAKPYAIEAGKLALDDYIKRMRVNANCSCNKNGGYRIQYALPSSLPLVSIIIPTFNELSLLRKCINSIKSKTAYKNYEIIVINNRSDDAKVIKYLHSMVQKRAIKVLDNDMPFNYSLLNNLAVKDSKGTVLCFLNNDIEVISTEWLSEMVSMALRPEIGAVGAKLFYPDGRIQHAGLILGLGGIAGHAFKRFPGSHHGQMGSLGLIQNFTAVTGACMVLEKSKFFEVNGFDQDNLPVAFNDVDICLKLLKAGYRNLWTPYAQLYHHESYTRGADFSPDKNERLKKESAFMIKSWRDLLYHDPAYNRNLTLEHEDFSLAWPPRENG
jgi:glycosyltransferase involved in cell wall biosynthesis